VEMQSQVKNDSFHASPRLMCETYQQRIEEQKIILKWLSIFQSHIVL